MENMAIYEAYRSVPEIAKKEIKGGRTKGFTDINPMWRIKALTERFGPCGIGWYYKVLKQWTEACLDQIAVFVNIELYIKNDGEWSMPIFGTGGSKLVDKERNGLYVSDECFKMALTDAISVSCKQLGIGADVYFEKDKSKYDIREKPIDTRLKPVYAELERIGYSEVAICKTYKVDSVESLSNLQIKDFLDKVKTIPDKMPK